MIGTLARKVWERNMDYILIERSFLILFQWFRFKWPFNTGGRQNKKAARSHSKVTTSSASVYSAMNGLLVKREVTVISSAPKVVVEKNPHDAFMGNVELEAWCFGLEWPVT